VGIHAHNDGGLAVANTLAAVAEGATHVQGTINGFGERCGNADLCVVIPNLAYKMGREVLGDVGLRRLTEVSRFVYELANVIPEAHQPFVGISAFAHKGGLHIDAVQKDVRTYEHISPERVGNERRLLVSELSGAATVWAKVDRYKLATDKALARKILEQVQQLENEGYQFEAAEASFELLVKKALGRHRRFFDLAGFHISVRKDEKGNTVAEATIKVKGPGGEIEHTASEGDGPVNALDAALRKALEKFYPSIKEMRLVDYKVRVVNPKAATAAKVRVIIQSRDHEDIWNTVGVSENILEASYQALVDSIEYKLLKDEERAGNV
jgi:2-isopropylmalate synthase